MLRDEFLRRLYERTMNDDRGNDGHHGKHETQQRRHIRRSWTIKKRWLYGHGDQKYDNRLDEQHTNFLRNVHGLRTKLLVKIRHCTKSTKGLRDS